MGQKSLNDGRVPSDRSFMLPKDTPLIDAGRLRTIVYHASQEALGARTETILNRLGYALILPEVLESLQTVHPELQPDLSIIDERRLDAVLSAGSAVEGLPIILLTGRGGAPIGDPRIVGAVKRPAGLHDLYRLLQQVFEDHPRATPRVETRLSARCEAGGKEWEGRVLSLSENGCLLRSPESIPLGQRLWIEIDLPERVPIRIQAEPTYQLLPDTGLVFSAIRADQREALERFVHETLLA